MNEIEKLAKPIINWLKENGNPHTQVIITLEQLRVTEDVLGIPMKD